MRGPMIGVIGAGSCTDEEAELAVEVGREIARAGGVLVCGGRGGIMEAAARGAKEVGGLTVGILPGPDIREANANIDVRIATNMGQARNAIIAQTAQAFIAIVGSYGTLSEMAMALKIGKAVVALRPRFDVPGVRVAEDPARAVRLAFEAVATGC